MIILDTAECGEVNQIYNMKWDDDERNIAYKKAFLRSLLLQVYAELFCKDLFPRKLKWSYPSSMSESLLRNYNTIWSSLPAVNPLNDANNHANVSVDPNYQLKVSTFGYNLQTSGDSGKGSSRIGSSNSFLNGGTSGGGSFLGGNSFLNNNSNSSQQSFTNNAFLNNSENKPLEENNKKLVAFERMTTLSHSLSTPSRWLTRTIFRV